MTGDKTLALDDVLEHVEARWTHWRAEHRDVALFYPPKEDGRINMTDEANYGLVEATREIAPDDDAVLRRFAADPLVWETRIDDPGESPKHAVQSAIEQIVGIRLDRKIQSGESS